MEDNNNNNNKSVSASASTSTSAKPTTPTDDSPTRNIPLFSMIFPGPFVNWLGGIFVSSTPTTAATTNAAADDDGDNLPPVPPSPPSQPQPQSSTIMNSKMDSITQEISVLKITVANQAATATAVAMASDQQDSAERNDSVQQRQQQRHQQQFQLHVLNEEEQRIIHNAIYGYGHDNDVVAHYGTDSVRRASMKTLKPGVWLNDEIIHYYYLILSMRDEELCRNDPTHQRSHFFKSFFMTKILNEGNASCEGTYEYRNVKRWSKKVPGKDIFMLNKIFFPINVDNNHWITAVIFMKKKRIEIFDSMGSDGGRYLKALFSYIQDEHMDKKNIPLPDADAWELIPTQPETPRQRNGGDCGVFTCMFADFLSTDTALVFTQHHITQWRERIALSIMTGKAII